MKDEMLKYHEIFLCSFNNLLSPGSMWYKSVCMKTLRGHKVLQNRPLLKSMKVKPGFKQQSQDVKSCRAMGYFPRRSSQKGRVYPMEKSVFYTPKLEG